MVMVNLILILLVGGVLALLSERVNENMPRRVALAVVLFDLIYFLNFLSGMPDLTQLQAPLPNDPSTWLMHFKADWIPAFGISIEFALDGISMLMVLLTLVLGAVAVSASWTDVIVRRGFFEANLLWTLAGVLGVFMALDLFLFFLFWEVMLIPMYFMIAIWGHENRGYAAMKFFIFTQASGLLMLVSILALVAVNQSATGQWSFSYFDLLNTPMAEAAAHWLMLGFFIAFVVKLPVFPFHTWLPDAHTQAPTAGSVILAGILLKTGAYGLIRFAVPLFPQAAMDFSYVAMVLGAVGVVYGAVLAFAQTDFKRLIAYSSVSHMGFVLLGVYAWNELALQGAVMQMVAHGFSTAALFMIAGSLQERLHTRDMREMGGLWQQMPRMGAVAMFFVVASLGLPGLGNFVAEFLVLLGLFQVDPWLTAVAALGLITGAAYSLILMQRAFQGEPNPTLADQGLIDFGPREMLTMAVMMLALIGLGIFPQPVLDIAQPVLQSLLEVTR
ncbi:MAG TPA: NADH-quinone oxidoreductase subunit M [Porticoccaceae bacterium]|jgi:NADH-quinone oxidoreductase subunit M|nr:NADH-quinone oxidoreductase subunit M [Porticoccaceae bacterium]